MLESLFLMLGVLFAEPGCFEKILLPNGTNVKFNRECGGSEAHSEETPLEMQYRALPVLAENQKKWEDHVRKFIHMKN